MMRVGVGKHRNLKPASGPQSPLRASSLIRVLAKATATPGVQMLRAAVALSVPAAQRAPSVQRKAMVAEYRCLKCGYEWSKQVEGGTLPLKHPHSDECPKCRSAYFVWTNFGRSTS